MTLFYCIMWLAVLISRGCCKGNLTGSENTVGSDLVKYVSGLQEIPTDGLVKDDPIDKYTHRNNSLGDLTLLNVDRDNLYPRFVVVFIGVPCAMLVFFVGFTMFLCLSHE